MVGFAFMRPAGSPARIEGPAAEGAAAAGPWEIEPSPRKDRPMMVAAPGRPKLSHAPIPGRPQANVVLGGPPPPAKPPPIAAAKPTPTPAKSHASLSPPKVRVRGGVLIQLVPFSGGGPSAPRHNERPPVEPPAKPAKKKAKKHKARKLRRPLPGAPPPTAAGPAGAMDDGDDNGGVSMDDDDDDDESGDDDPASGVENTAPGVEGGGVTTATTVPAAPPPPPPPLLVVAPAKLAAALTPAVAVGKGPAPLGRRPHKARDALSGALATALAGLGGPPSPPRAGPPHAVVTMVRPPHRTPAVDPRLGYATSHEAARAGEAAVAAADALASSLAAERQRRTGDGAAPHASLSDVHAHEGKLRPLRQATAVAPSPVVEPPLVDVHPPLDTTKDGAHAGHVSGHGPGAAHHGHGTHGTHYGHHDHGHHDHGHDHGHDRGTPKRGGHHGAAHEITSPRTPHGPHLTRRVSLGTQLRAIHAPGRPAPHAHAHIPPPSHASPRPAPHAWGRSTVVPPAADADSIVSLDVL